MCGSRGPFLESHLIFTGSKSWKPVVSILTQAAKLHKNFVHFKYSLRVKKKNILGEYRRSLSQVCGTIHTSNE